MPKRNVLNEPHAHTGVVLASLLALSCSSVAAEGDWKRWLNPATAPFIPIPEVGTDPNSGTTLGVLPVWLGTNARNEIERIVAPDAIYNPYLGLGARFRYYAYPSDDTQWYVVAGGKQHVDREVDISYWTGRQRAGPWTFLARFEYDRNGTQRFFGLGNASKRADESNYTRQLVSLGLNFGFNFTQRLQLSWETRPRHWSFSQGAISSLPRATENFAEVPGFSDEFEWHNRLSLRYDSRDSITVPTRGSQFVLFAGMSDRALLSSVSYSYFGLDARHYQAIGSNSILAAHLTMRYTPAGSKAPFWALSRLGGDRSVTAERQALRGFGEDRFIGRHMLAFNLEWRREVINLALFGTRVTFELAPFIDAGRVFQALDDNPFSQLHWAGGLGIRGIAKPYVVGYLDGGYGTEGLAIFSGIDYPF